MSKPKKKVFNSFQDAFGVKDNKEECVFKKDGLPLNLKDYDNKVNSKKEKPINECISKT